MAMEHVGFHLNGRRGPGVDIGVPCTIAGTSFVSREGRGDLPIVSGTCNRARCSRGKGACLYFSGNRDSSFIRDCTIFCDSKAQCSCFSSFCGNVSSVTSGIGLPICSGTPKICGVGVCTVSSCKDVDSDCASVSHSRIHQEGACHEGLTPRVGC